MLQVGAVTILFFSLSTLSNGLLQGIGRMKEPIKNAIIALVLHLGLLAALMFLFDLNIFAVVIANAAFGLIMCILNAGSIRRYSGYHQEIRKTFLSLQSPLPVWVLLYGSSIMAFCTCCVLML